MEWHAQYSPKRLEQCGPLYLYPPICATLRSSTQNGSQAVHLSTSETTSIPIASSICVGLAFFRKTGRSVQPRLRLGLDLKQARTGRDCPDDSLAGHEGASFVFICVALDPEPHQTPPAHHQDPPPNAMIDTGCAEVSNAGLQAPSVTQSSLCLSPLGACQKIPVLPRV